MIRFLSSLRQSSLNPRETKSASSSIGVVTQKRWKWTSGIQMEPRITGEEHEDRENEMDDDEKDNVVANAQPHLINSITSLPIQETLEIRRHVNVTANGRVQSFSALVICGDGRGTGGLGYGKGESPVEAVERAYRDVERNMISIYRFEDRTVPYTCRFRYMKSEILFKPRMEGSGLVVAKQLQIIAEVFGFKDLTLRSYGRRNIRHQMRAIFIGLRTLKSPEETAKERGLKWVNIERYWKPSQIEQNELGLD
jgi:small subunit ribosomal protein S5